MSNAQNNDSLTAKLQTAQADAYAWKKRYEDSQKDLAYAEAELKRLKARFAKEIQQDAVDVVLDIVANESIHHVAHSAIESLQQKLLDAAKIR